MQLTGIKWLDIVIMLLLSSGALGMGWKYLISRSKVHKAMEQNEWMKTLEPIVGAAINKAEAWGKKHSKQGSDKLEHATDVVMKGMDAVGIPKKFKNKELIESLIESKLTGGNLADVALSTVSKVTNGG